MHSELSSLSTPVEMFEGQVQNILRLSSWLVTSLREIVDFLDGLRQECIAVLDSPFTIVCHFLSSFAEDFVNSLLASKSSHNLGGFSDEDLTLSSIEAVVCVVVKFFEDGFDLSIIRACEARDLFVLGVAGERDGHGGGGEEGASEGLHA